MGQVGVDSRFHQLIGERGRVIVRNRRSALERIRSVHQDAALGVGALQLAQMIPIVPNIPEWLRLRLAKSCLQRNTIRKRDSDVGDCDCGVDAAYPGRRVPATLSTTTIPIAPAA